MAARPRNRFTYLDLSRAYGCSTAHAANLLRYFSMEALSNPDELFQTMIDTSRQSPLRKRLSDPKARAKATASLAAAADRRAQANENTRAKRQARIDKILAIMARSETATRQS